MSFEMLSKNGRLQIETLRGHVLQHASYLYYYTTVLEIKESDHMQESIPNLKHIVQSYV